MLLKVIGWLGGSMLLGVVILILVAVIAWQVIKHRWSGFFVKAQIAAQPPHLHLIRERQPMWDDFDEVRNRVDILRGFGFRAIGTFGIQEMDGFQLVAMAHPNQGYAAAVFEHTDQGQWCDFAARCHDTRDWSSRSGPVTGTSG